MIVAEPGADRRQSLGRLGEEVAARALEQAGFRIVERRARTRVGEIDIVAEEGEILVFVEVKARRGTGYGRPAEAVTAGKRRRLARVALVWLAKRRCLQRRCRFDVVEVYATGDAVHRIRLLRDAFRA